MLVIGKVMIKDEMLLITFCFHFHSLPIHTFFLFLKVQEIVCFIKKIINIYCIQGISRVIIMSPAGNATDNTTGGKAGYLSPPCPGLRSNVLWVAFSIPPGSLSPVKHLPCIIF
jgi:hypothetical protein